MGEVINLTGEDVPPTGRRQGDELVEVVAARVESILESMGEMKVSLNKLTDAVTRLALVEERQAQMTQAHDRTVRYIEKVEAAQGDLDKRIKVLEVAEPLQQQASKWVMAAVWAVVGGAASVGLHAIANALKFTL